MDHTIWTILTPDMIFASFLQNLEKQIKKNQISNRAQQLGAPGPMHPEVLTAGPVDQRDPRVSDTAHVRARTR